MKNHRAAILTFCNNNGQVNYGQIYQCYAVQKILSDMGFDTRIVKYQKFEYRCLTTKRVRRFKEFEADYLNVTESCYSINDVERVTSDCRILVCGSDQVWFPETVDDVWTLGFGTAEQIRISFAASGLFYFNENTVASIGRYLANLERFNFITVRENSARQILCSVLKKDVEVVPDPTLLLGQNGWNKVLKDEKNKEDYLFCYCLGGIRSYDLIFREIRKLYGNIEIKYIPSNLMNEGEYRYLEAIDDAGPSEFLGYLKNAKAVITDSYHGIIFSIIFGLDWYNVDRHADEADRFGSKQRVGQVYDFLGNDMGWIKNVKDVNARYNTFRNGIDYSGIIKRAKESYKLIESTLGIYVK